MKTKVISLIIVILYAAGLAREYKWHLKLENGDVYPNVALVQVIGDSLQIHVKSIKEINLDQYIQIPLEVIVEIIEEKKSKTGILMLGGVVIGTGIGLGIGHQMDLGGSDFIFGNADVYTVTGGVIGGLTGLLVGAITGSIVGKDKNHDIREYTLQKKKDYLGKFITENKNYP